MRPVLISVVIVNWNRCALLREACLSVRKQGNVETELIVVDNGSTDDSVAMLRAEFPSARLIANGKNLGFCAANNQGIAAAAGEYIALLNNDAVAQPGWLWALLQVFDGKPRVGMAASKILMASDPRRIDKVGHLIWPDGQNRGRGSGALDVGQFDRVEPTLWPDGCAAMYRKAMLDQIGGFDEDFFAYADDAELGLRARIAGWECLYTPFAVVHHHRGATLGVNNARRLKLIERNRILLAVKLFPASLLWMNAFYFAGRIAAGVQAAFRGEGETALFPGVRGKLTLAAALVAGNVAALPLIPRMLAKRRAIQSIRQLTPAQVKALILGNRIPLKELSTQAALP
jgi:GT2 family glycosyltransferase